MSNINELIQNWESAPVADVPKQVVSIRIPAQLFAKIQALSEMFERNRVEIMIDLMENCISQLSESLSREHTTKADLWRETYEESNGMVPREDFDFHYPGPDSKIFRVGPGVRFDNLWRRNFKKLADASKSSVQETEQAQTQHIEEEAA